MTKTENTKYIRKVKILLNRIETAYQKLGIENEDFFNQYHDNMLIQRDCSFDVGNDIEHYLSKNDLKSADWHLEQLEKTTKYCEAIIELQTQTLALPECIFG